jgi:hypothetical protein
MRLTAIAQSIAHALEEVHPFAPPAHRFNSRHRWEPVRRPVHASVSLYTTRTYLEDDIGRTYRFSEPRARVCAKMSGWRISSVAR